VQRKPLHQRQVGIVENGPRRNAKIVVATEAVVLFTFGYFRRFIVVTARALETVTPAQSLQIFAAFRFVAKLLNQSAKIHGVCHV
jgi:hypothetical protein